MLCSWNGSQGFFFNYEGCSIKTENNFEKNLYFWNYSVFTTVLLRYSPLSATHFAQRFCHSSNGCWNPFRAKRLKAVSTASNAASGNSKWRPLRSFTCRKQEEIPGCEVWAVESCKESLLHHARLRNLKHISLHAGVRYSDATSIDHYDNAVAYKGHGLQ